MIKCLCSKCKGQLALAAQNFKKEYIKQQVDLKDVQIDNITSLKNGRVQAAPIRQKIILPVAKTKPKVHKRSKPVKHTLNKEKISKVHSPKATEPSKNVAITTVKKVSKVPPCEFPSEISDGMNRDPSLENDYRTVFTPEGCHVREDIPVLNNTQSSALPKEAEARIDGEDGNVDYCLLCDKSGGLICCEKCPRAFHASCLLVNQSELPDDWECPRCTEDCTQQEKDEVHCDDHETLAQHYQKFEGEDGHDFWKELTTLGKILEVVKSMINYDFGRIFAAPVSVKDVPDYRTIVKRPMDLGTIQNNIMKGVYGKKVERLIPEGRKVMEQIILETLKDIEQVWHNCFLYNREGENCV